jgi:hypothetical protein
MAARLVAIHQSNLFPRIKVICKLSCADIAVGLDDVQYAAREWQNRLIVCRTGAPVLLTMPVSRPHGRRSKLDEVLLFDKARNATRLKSTIRRLYRRSPHWRDVDSYVENVFDAAGDHLCDLAARSVWVALDALSPESRYERSVSLDRDENLDASERLVAIARTFGASHYVSGSGGRGYLKEEYFRRHRLKVVFQSWNDDASLLGTECSRNAGNLSVVHYIADLGIAELRRRLTRVRVDRRTKWGLEV